jgi:hypothetical protein
MIPWGDSPQIKGKKTCRILFQNVNGISQQHKFAKRHIIGSEAELLEVDILGMAQTNINWHQQEPTLRCTHIFRNYWKQTKIGTSTSSFIFKKHTGERIKSMYKPGGTMTITGFPWASRTTARKDPTNLGRWNESELTGEHNRKVTVITAYNVCKANISDSGPKTAYTQQYCLLKELNPNKKPNPRAQLLLDLGKRIRELKNQQQEVIILCDANDSLQNPNSQFSNWAQQLGLIDILVERHGTDDEPPTYIRGST